MPNPDESTVVGVFDEYSAAQAAARELESAGVPRSAINIRSNVATGAAGRGTAETEHRGFFSGFFHDIFHGAPQDEEGHYLEAVRRGGTLLAVTVPQKDVDRTVEILNQHGAVDIDRRVETYRQAGYTKYDANAPAYTADEAARERQRIRETSATIPVVEEEVQVGKRAVRRGGVRVYTHVVEEPVHESVKLREEHAVVERRKVDRPVEPADEAAMRDQSIEVTEMGEEPVVGKRARVKEEVVIGKEARERTEEIHDTVRRTEVDVQPIEGGKVESGTVGQTGRTAAGITDFRSDYDSFYSKSGIPFETIRPAYEFGREKALDSRYRGKEWSEVEPELKREFTSAHPGAKWNDVKGAIQRTWQRARAA